MRDDLGAAAAGGRLRGSPLGTLVAVTVALFSDGFLYGVMLPLTSASPAGTDEEWLLGVMYGAYAVGVLIATPVLGLFSDRIGRRSAMLWGVSGQALATGLFATAHSIPPILLARLCQGMAAAATWTAGLALIAERFRERRAEKLGVGMMGSTGGLLLGPVMGGALLEWGGYHLPLAVTGALLALDATFRAGLLAGGPVAEARQPAGLLSLLRDRSVVAASFVVILAAGSWSLLEPLFPHHLKRVAGASPAVIGLIFTLSAVAYGLTTPLMARAVARWGAWPTMIVGAVAMAASLPLLAMPTTVVPALGALVVVNVAYGFLMNPTLSELADAVDRRGSGTYAAVYGIYNVAYSVGNVGSDVGAGFLASALSFRASLWGVSLVLIASVPLLNSFRLATRSPAAGSPAERTG
jgi:MFS transporter, DHA1 family, solute carrier family 18 (vesicular amine transporter), member 1/2